MSDHNDPQTEQWHLDKRVPVALIWAIAVQTMAVLIAGTLFWSDMQQTRRDLDRLDAATARQVQRIDSQIDRITGAAQSQAVQLGRIEENLGAMRSDMRRLVSIWEGGAP